jgi:hypothetical protein
MRLMKKAYCWVVVLALTVASLAIAYWRTSKNYEFDYLGPLALNTPFSRSHTFKHPGEYHIALKAYYEGRDHDTHDRPLINYFTLRSLDDLGMRFPAVPAGESVSNYSVNIPRPSTVEFSGSIKAYCADCDEREGNRTIKEVYLYFERVHD